MAPKATAPAEDVDHSAFVSVSSAYGANTPKASTKAPALTASSVWNDVKRLKARDTRSQNLLLKGYTHICIYPLEAHADTGEPQFCHEPLRLSTTSAGTWLQIQGQRHKEREHPESQAAIDRLDQKAESQRGAESSAAADLWQSWRRWSDNFGG